MDYCTFWPEGWWAHCCKAHDDSYLTQAGQAIADGSLFQCVANSAPTPALAVASGIIGAVMWAGVRTFGSYFYRKARPSQQTDKDL